jgi:type I restriction enzyme R subunit
MFCVSDVPMLLDYYRILKKRKDAKKNNLTVATIFSCSGEEDRETATSQIETDLPNHESSKVNTGRLAQLQSCVADYNKKFKTSYSAADNKSFYEYYQDISRRVRSGEIDILLVVNMFLTGFDSQKLNTLYVDKNLKHHGLIQAFSRTNRVFDEGKTQGNIVCFRNLKDQTDEALSIFANQDAKEEVLEDVRDTVVMPEYREMKADFSQKLKEMKDLVDTVDEVDDLKGETSQAKFVEAFKDVIKAKKVISNYSEYAEDMDAGEFAVSEQELAEYQGKYLDLYDKIKRRKEATDYEDKKSVLDDIDFEVGLFKRDEVNVDYILGLIGKSYVGSADALSKEEIRGIAKSTPGLVDKVELLDDFMDTLDEDDFTGISNVEAKVISLFESFLAMKAKFSIEMICVKEGMDEAALNKMIASYISTGKPPLDDELMNAVNVRVGIRDRGRVTKRIRQRIDHHINSYVN